MEYRRSKYIGDYNIDEVFEGTPKEIVELMNLMSEELVEEKELIYDIDEAIEYIGSNVEGISGYVECMIEKVLELEVDYMRSIGIIED